MDFRVQWFRNYLCQALGVQEPRYIESVLSDHHDSLIQFFEEEITDNRDDHKRLFFAWRTFYDRLVEKTVKVLEPVAPPVEAEPQKEKKGKKGKIASATAGAKKAASRDAKEDDSADAKPDPETGAGGGGGGFVDNPEAARSGHADGMEDAEKGKKGKKKKKDADEPEVEPEMVEVTKIVSTYVKTPIVHVCFGFVPEDELDPSLKYAYVVRKLRSPIAPFENYKDCFAEMPQNVIFGCMKGALIDHVQEMMERIYKPSVQHQFREPDVERPKPEKDTEADEENVRIESRSSVQLVDYTKPSDFRMKALRRRSSGFRRSKDLDSNVELGSQSLSETPSSESNLTQTKASETTLESEPLKETPSEKWENLLIAANIKIETEKEKLRNVPPPTGPMKENLTQNLNQFVDVLEWTMGHVQYDFGMPTQYNVPGQENITIDEDKIKIKVDIHKTTVEELTPLQKEEIVEGWSIYIRKVLRESMEREPAENTPMAEYELWLGRELEYNSIIEQLKSPFVIEVFDSLKDSESPIMKAWPSHFKDLKEALCLAKDNVEHLAMLQKYLLKIKNDEDFNFILSIIPNVTIILRHIWTMSNYYSKDQNMLILLGQISYVFAEKVKILINVDTIFK
ncbi:uncharacterized protein LOC129738373 [Uranotaenia lowii]|uniref:uncharacterized protein LOC129738373 n=1 Tax=Uranotaenia lowii TaxID=190385 RepID=UPI002478EC0D|nr:uncharacterized protein LOC129738373 [Uranotaenia lowii]